MSEFVVVSNGLQWYRIPTAQLEKAQSEGYYRPAEQGRAVVSDGARVLEIPVEDLAWAQADGFRNVLQSENHLIASEVAASNGDTVSIYRQAELDHESKHEELALAAETAGWLGKWPALSRLWWFEQRASLLRHFRTSGMSVAIHLAILLLLSTILLVDDNFTNPDVLTVSTAVEDPIDEIMIEPVDLQIEEPVDEIVEPTEAQETLPEITQPLVAIDALQNIDSALLAAPDPGGATGEGDAMDKPAKAKIKFFGSKTEAVDFVFVIDNSNSMSRGRFETALNELVKAVNKLNRRQKFFVIFYSDTAYPLFHPKPPKTLVPATTKNKLLLSRWLQTVPLCLKTNGREALQLGFSLDPDVMFVLGDGAFTDGASKYFSANPKKGVIVHTLGMEVDVKNAQQFKMLADTHGGTYQDVGVHPEAALIAKRTPRMRNNRRNGYWGLKLPVVAKKKKKQ